MRVSKLSFVFGVSISIIQMAGAQAYIVQLDFLKQSGGWTITNPGGRTSAISPGAKVTLKEGDNVTFRVVNINTAAYKLSAKFADALASTKSTDDLLKLLQPQTSAPTAAQGTSAVKAAPKPAAHPLALSARTSQTPPSDSKTQMDLAAEILEQDNALSSFLNAVAKAQSKYRSDTGRNSIQTADGALASLARSYLNLSASDQTALTDLRTQAITAARTALDTISADKAKLVAANTPYTGQDVSSGDQVDAADQVFAYFLNPDNFTFTSDSHFMGTTDFTGDLTLSPDPDNPTSGTSKDYSFSFTGSHAPGNYAAGLFFDSLSDASFYTTNNSDGKTKTIHQSTINDAHLSLGAVYAYPIKAFSDSFEVDACLGAGLNQTTDFRLYAGLAVSFGPGRHITLVGGLSSAQVARLNVADPKTFTGDSVPTETVSRATLFLGLTYRP
jgi:hypothetical protein